MTATEHPNPRLNLDEQAVLHGILSLDIEEKQRLLQAMRAGAIYRPDLTEERLVRDIALIRSAAEKLGIQI